MADALRTAEDVVACVKALDLSSRAAMWCADKASSRAFDWSDDAAEHATAAFHEAGRLLELVDTAWRYDEVAK